MPPSKYRNKQACNQAGDLDADFYPVADRRGVAMSDTMRPPVQKIRVEIRDFSLGKAMPQLAAAIDAQIDCDDASDDFIKERPHARVLACPELVRPSCGTDSGIEIRERGRQLRRPVRSMKEIEMMKLALVFLILPVFAFAVTTPLHAASDVLAGSWIVTWDNNPENKNSLSLQNKDGRLSGTYINDSKQSCPVTGKIGAASDRNLVLKVVCPAWNIDMQGASDDQKGSGTYRAYGKVSGVFTMVRQ